MKQSSRRRERGGDSGRKEPGKVGRSARFAMECCWEREGPDSSDLLEVVKSTKLLHSRTWSVESAA